jgi:GNAT superfamily N-acetyltransferase
MSNPVVVRRATAEDRDAVVATVVAAFATDPAWGFITDGEIERLSPYFAGALFDGRADAGTVWVTDDCRAVAMWDDRTGATTGDLYPPAIWEAYRAVAGEAAWSTLQAYDGALHVHEPAEPFWYLGVLATHPSAQGTGLATAVMRPVLDIADSVGIDCWLETSVPGNTEFYARRGFTERIEVEIDGGPTTWWMRRPAEVPRRSVERG